MKKIQFTILFIILFNSTLYSFDKFALSYGYKNGINLYGLSLIKNINYNIIENTNISVELSSQYVNGRRDHLMIYSIQPLIDYNFTNSFYIEGGVGIAHFTKEYIDNRKFGMNFQFKESIGFGYKFTKNLETTLKYNHYSNADIVSSNAGLDFIDLRLIYRF